MARTKRFFGTIRRLPSKMYQASYIGPDVARHNAPGTFTARADAEGWIALERRLIEWDEWMPPAQRRAKQLHDDTQTLRTYADTWLPERTAVRGLKPKTVSEYQRYLDRLIYPMVPLGIWRRAAASRILRGACRAAGANVHVGLLGYGGGWGLGACR